MTELAENRGDWEVVARNMVKILGGVSVNAGPRSMEICSFRGSNPGGAMGGRRVIPYKNRRVMWKDGERNENRRRCKYTFF